MATFHSYGRVERVEDHKCGPLLTRAPARPAAGQRGVTVLGSVASDQWPRSVASDQWPPINGLRSVASDQWPQIKSGRVPDRVSTADPRWILAASNPDQSCFMPPASLSGTRIIAWSHSPPSLMCCADHINKCLFCFSGSTSPLYIDSKASDRWGNLVCILILKLQADGVYLIYIDSKASDRWGIYL